MPRGSHLATGKAELVVFKEIAAHPKRSLVADGYTNWLITIASNTDCTVKSRSVV